MSPIAAGSALGAAAVTIGRGLLGAASGGLSFAAELAQAAAGISENSKAAPEVGGPVQAALDQRREAMRHRIQRHLAELGIQLTSPLELISDGLGGIDVAGPHPQGPAIEEALASDILLERDFNQLVRDHRDWSEANGSGIADPFAVSLTIPKNADSRQIGIGNSDNH